MFTGYPLSWLAVAAALTAPAALACEDPDNMVFALRATPPVGVNFGEVVLELDVDSLRVVEKDPITPRAQDHKPEIYTGFGVFAVKRVLEGAYDDKQATIQMVGSSCWSLGEGPYLLAKPAVDGSGFRYLAALPQTYAAIRTQSEKAMKVAH